MARERLIQVMSGVAIALLFGILPGCPPETTYTLTVSVEPGPAAGSVEITPDKESYEQGESIRLRAVPAAGYSFRRWKGSFSGQNSEVRIFIQSDLDITAEFRVSQPGEGEVEPEGEDEGEVEGEGDSLAVRSITGTSVDIHMTPPADSNVWGVEEIVPQGLSVQNVVGPNGEWDRGQGRVFWWSTDPTPVTLQYELTGPDGVYTITGRYGFDGDVFDITGDSRLVIGTVEGEGEGEIEGEGEPVVEGEGEPVIEGEGEPVIEGEGEVPVEGEGEPVVEGEGEPVVEGEGEVPAEGEGEPVVEGEGEPVVEGEGEVPVEGEGEPGIGDALAAYVQSGDGCYAYTQPVRQLFGIPGTGVTVDVFIVARMMSQCWNPDGLVYDGAEWTHPVVIFSPRTRVSDTAMLFIDGGSRNSSPELNTVLANIAAISGTPVVHIANIPSQPMTFEDEVIPPGEQDNYSGADFALRQRSEDAAIAYTYDKYLEDFRDGHEADTPWPLLFPMVKAAVKAMDTAENVLQAAGEDPIENFVVAGASKRGWTTWLTGAVDDRVKAVAPIVINVLNMEKNLSHHRQSYGYWSPAIYDYAQMGVFDQLIPTSAAPVLAAEAEALLKLVDPYRYARAGKYDGKPIFMLNATGDEFFVPDRGLDDDTLDVLAGAGEAYQSFIPNVGHGMGGLESALNMSDPYSPGSMFLAWYMAISQDVARPEFNWYFEDDGAIRVVADEDRDPVSVRLWSATSAGKRDFRNPVLGPAWTSTDLAPGLDGVTYTGRVSAPQPGDYKAFFIQLEYDNTARSAIGINAPNFVFSTPVRVLPVDEDGNPTYPEFTSVNASEERPDAVHFGADKLPVTVVYGTPREMGYYYGQAMKDSINSFLLTSGYVSPFDPGLAQVWNDAEDWLDPRILEEIEGISEGAEVNLGLLQLAHAQALYQMNNGFRNAGLIPYRNMVSGHEMMHAATLNAPDVSAKIGLEGYFWEDYLCMVMYVPERGLPHVNFTYAGLAFGFTGGNIGGITVSPISEPGAAASYTTAPLMRSVLYDALSLRDALEMMDAAANPPRDITLLVGDGRNERRAAWARYNLAGARIAARYDQALSDFSLRRPGIVYGASGDAARGALWQLLNADIDALTFAQVMTMTATVPTASAGNNLLNVVYDFQDENFTLFVAASRNHQEAFRDYFDQAFIQALLP